jgi:hypothetical protein
MGIQIKAKLPDPKASVARIVRKYKLSEAGLLHRVGGGKRLDSDVAAEIVGNRFFSNYFTYDDPSPALVAALRCDPDVARVDYNGML